MGVRGESAVQREAAVFDERAPFALGAETRIFELDTTLMVKWSEIPATSMSSRATPAMRNASSAAPRPEKVVSDGAVFGSRYPCPSPHPSNTTGACRPVASTSRREVTTTQPPPWFTMQQSRRCSGSAIMRDDNTCSTVISPRGPITDRGCSVAE